MAVPKLPRPSQAQIVAAIGGIVGMRGHPGLGIQIDPGSKTTRGAMIYANELDFLGLQLRTFREPLEATLRQVLVPSIKENFQQQGRPAWQKLAPSTIRKRLLEGYPRGPILERSGRLKKQATKLNIWQVSANQIRIRSSYFEQLVPYARFMQFGTSQRNKLMSTGHISFSSLTNRFMVSESRALRVHNYGGIPARPFIQLTVDEEAAVQMVFYAWLVGKVNKYWGPEERGLFK